MVRGKGQTRFIALCLIISPVIECHLFKLIKWLTGGDDEGT